MDKQEDRISDSIKGHEADVIDNESSISCLLKQEMKLLVYVREKKN